MYFPEYNAILVPAESISPDYLPSTRRSKPIRGLVRLIKERMDGVESSGESSENASIASLSGQTEGNDMIVGNTSDPEGGEEVVHIPKPSHRPLKRPEEFLAEEVPATTIDPQSQPKDEVKLSPVVPAEKFFQRPNRPLLPTPVETAPEISPDGTPTQTPNRPTLVSFIPTRVTNYFQTPPKLPFSSFFEDRFPGFFTPVVSPRNPYIHYYTKTPTSEAFYYNALHPTVRQAAYSDAVQSEISDYVNHVQESILQEQEISTPSSSNSAMMVASVPMGKNQATSLVLRPVAKAVAGPKGVAVASPVAKAVLRKGEKVDIDFDPDAVAIAGPGGQAHAHPKLIISYNNEKTDEPSSETLNSSS